MTSPEVSALQPSGPHRGLSHGIEAVEPAIAPASSPLARSPPPHARLAAMRLRLRVGPRGLSCVRLRCAGHRILRSTAEGCSAGVRLGIDILHVIHDRLFRPSIAPAALPLVASSVRALRLRPTGGAAATARPLRWMSSWSLPGRPAGGRDRSRARPTTSGGALAFEPSANTLH